MKKLIKFFDVLEDKIRARLSRHPLVYGLVSGVGIVMFYRGLWMVFDEYPFMTGWVTLIIATVILLLSGVFVSQFVSNHIILSGIKKEKKLVEQVGQEVKAEARFDAEILAGIKKLQADVDDLKKAKNS
jgi:hypothetical protein